MNTCMLMQHKAHTKIASISPSSSSLTLGLQNLAGASQNSLNASLLPLLVFAPLFDELEEDASNFFTKSENDFWSSGGAAGCRCWPPMPDISRVFQPPKIEGAY